MLVAGIILFLIVTWFYKSRLPRRDQFVILFIVSFCTFVALPGIDELTAKFPFNSLNRAVEQAFLPLIVLVACAFGVSILGLLWFELVEGETSYERYRIFGGRDTRSPDTDWGGDGGWGDGGGDGGD